MLTREENDLLTRTGPGTPMGRLLRRYWVPVLFSRQLPGPDCPPVRVKVLGEKLVAFRDSRARPALVGERCPHRGASLFFGRNEEEGLRCVYHGWKFDAAGTCVDMPSETPQSNFRHKVKLTAYPCTERGGLVWAYMGPAERMPEFPELEWTAVPESHRFATRHIQECNWFQALEGGFDTSHLTFLHRGDTPDGRTRPLPELYEVVPTDFGMVTGSGRRAADGSTSWTVNIMGMPFHKVISRGGTGEYPIGAHVWVPIDDESCMIYSVEYRHDRPLGEMDLERSKKWLYIHAETLPGSDRCVRNLANDFLIDRESQKSGKSYTGLTGFGIQDCGIQESMGPIVDRTLEHLGASDTHIIKLRRQMLRFVREHEAGKPVPGLQGDSYRVRSAGFSTAPGVKFEDAVIEQVRIETHLLSMAK